MYGVVLSSPSTWGWLRRSAGVALVAALCMGTVSLPGVWAATFYVDDDTGDDNRSAAEAQNPSTPWKTITTAIGEPTLVPGDTIQVASGTYDQALGETFPLYLVDGVAIIGDPNDPNSRVINVPDNRPVFENNDTALTSATKLAGFRLTSEDATYRIMMYFPIGSVAMAPEIRDNVFVAGGISSKGVEIIDNASGDRSFTGLIENNAFVDIREGVGVYGNRSGTADLSPTIRGNTFSGCVTAIDVVVESSFSGTVSPVIFNNTATGSVERDVNFYLSLTGGHGPTSAPLIANNTFTGSGRTSIYLSVDTMSLSYSSDTGTFSPTVLNNNITNAGYSGVEYCLGDVESSNIASEITIAGNTMTNPGYEGVLFDLSGLSDAESVFFDWTISNNTITHDSPSPPDGIAIEGTTYMDIDDGGSIDLTVSGNAITGANDAVGIELGALAGAIDFDLTVSGNTITGGVGSGGYLIVSYQTSFTDSDMAVRDNVVDGKTEDGVYLSFGDYTSATSYAEVTCNTLVNNGRHGFNLSSDDNAPPPDLGGGDLSSPGLNTFSGNGTTGGYDFYTYDPNDVAAHNNWWGTTDTGVIEANIWDSNDDPTLGTVDYSGYLSAAPTVLATASLVDALQVDLPPTGPSYGDTIRYTATLEGTGDCGCASALFTAPIPVNATYVSDSLIASRGIVINEHVSAGHPALKVGLGALAAGEAVTITWDVMAGQGCCLTSQATLNCYQLGDLLTDDPNAPGDEDPTTVDLPNLFCDGFESGDVSSW